MTEQSTRFTPVPGLDDLATLFDRSAEGSVVLFLHDYYCPISTMAYDEMLNVQGDISLIDVADQRDLSKEIATRPSASAIIIGCQKRVSAKSDRTPGCPATCRWAYCPVRIEARLEGTR